MVSPRSSTPAAFDAHHRAPIVSVEDRAGLSAQRDPLVDRSGARDGRRAGTTHRVALAQPAAIASAIACSSRSRRRAPPTQQRGAAAPPSAAAAPLSGAETAMASGAAKTRPIESSPAMPATNNPRRDDRFDGELPDRVLADELGIDLVDGQVERRALVALVGRDPSSSSRGRS